MASFDTMAGLIADRGSQELAGDPPVTALYASAGADTKPFTFTHPEFLARRGLSDVPAPNVFVFVDRGRQPAPGFRDVATRIETLTEESVTVGGIGMRLLSVRFTSTSLATRTLAVVAIEADNERMSAIWHREAWVPEIFIGVCDGCRSGGNRHCVNRLEAPPGMPASLAERVPAPPWWITDHFANVRTFGGLRNGDCVESLDGGFPLRFRKRALLSSDWGTYGGSTVRGATLFSVERQKAADDFG
jgi:hypothetical protein